MDLLTGWVCRSGLVTGDTAVNLGFVLSRRLKKGLDLLQEMKPDPAKPGAQTVLGMVPSHSCS